MGNRQWFALHGWLGVNLGYLLLVICLSGTVATLSSEIDWLLDPALRNSSQASQEPSSPGLQDYYAVAARHYPEGEVTLVRKPPEAYLPVQVMVSEAGRGNFLLHLDRYTGDILAERSLLAARNFFRIFHKQFFVIAGPYSFHGLWITGLFGLVLLISVVSALSFMKSWLTRLTRLHWKKGLRVFFAEWHRSTGLWALVFSLMFALTGMWYWIELASDLGEVDLPAAPQESLAAQGEYLQEPDIARYLEVALNTLPGLEPTTVRLPTRPGGAVHVMGQTDALLVRDAANRVALNPVDVSVIDVSRTGSMGALERWVHTVDPLHFGNFAGPGLKLVWFAFGVLITLSVWVGFKLWLLRVQVVRRRAGPGSRRLTYFAASFTVAFLLVATLFSIAGVGRLQAGETQELLSYASLPLGPWTPELRGRRQPGDDRVTLQLVFPGARPNFARAWVHLAQEPGQRRLEFVQQWQDIHLEEPVLLDRARNLEIVLADHHGVEYRYSMNAEQLAHPRILRVVEPARTAPGVKVLVYGFLAMIWLGLVLWLRAQFRCIRRTRG